MYNDLNRSWANGKLTGPGVQHFNSSSIHMGEFSQLRHRRQDESELLLLTAGGNVLADMWSYNIIAASPRPIRYSVSAWAGLERYVEPPRQEAE